jgi:hypothetical protein
MKQDLVLKNRVKDILKIVQQVAPGNSLELRIPPYAANQCVSGSVHRRVTPPNVVEVSGDSLMELVSNPTSWDEFCHIGRIPASGTNSNLKDLFTQAGKLGSNLK